MTVMIRDRQKHTEVNLRMLRSEASRLLKLLGIEKTELSILIVEDGQMKDLNFSYRKKDKTTDVLSFPMFESLEEVRAGGPGALLGDIVINAPLSERMAADNGVPSHFIIRQLLIHGLLHLVGYDHEKGRSRALEMKKKERELADALAQVD